MNIRRYNHEQDFEPIFQFLTEIYQPGESLNNWLPSRWEYMHYHTAILELDRSKIGIVEENEQIVAVVHFESNEAEVILEVRPGYDQLKPELLNWAEENDYEGMSRSRGKLFRAVYVNQNDTALEDEVQSRGYEKWEDFGEPHSVFDLRKLIPVPSLPEGYAVQSLEVENDLRKINQVLWRGFNHSGEPPEEEIPGREFGQQAPNFRKDLTIVTVAPDGRYTSYCGMYYIPEIKVAYLEPLATDPDFRRMGMAKAAVLESLRRVQALGAEVCWVGSGQDFYTVIGFEKKFTTYPWAKILE
jgi:predicted N-acetyltransferase YhbS